MEKNASCIYASFNISLFYSASMSGGVSAPKLILKLHLPSDVRVFGDESLRRVLQQFLQSDALPPEGTERPHPSDAGW